MKRFIGLILGLSLSVLNAGCNKADPPTVQAQAAPPLILGKSSAPASGQPRLLHLKLTLDQPSDLKVKAQETITVGQVLSDRASQRDQLTTKRQMLQLKLQKLQVPAVVLNLPGRPGISYVEEAAKVEGAKQKLGQVKKAIAHHESSSPWTKTAIQKLGLRDDKLIQLESQLTQAQAEYDSAWAQLQAAKEQRQDVEYEDQLNQAKQVQPKDTSVQQEQIVTQLNAIETELDGLGVVRSPYGGIVKQIKWLGQHDQRMEVELLIEVAPDRVVKEAR